jgi:hypothetical protein
MGVGRGNWRPLIDGLLAGAAGGAVMSVSTNLEMRLRGRPPSVVPVQTLERILGLYLSRSVEERLVTVGHLLSSAGLGLIRGALDLTPAAPGAQELGFAACAYLPDFALIPIFGDVPAPWRWSGVELATSALHHGVYAAGTIGAYRALSRRSG